MPETLELTPWINGAALPRNGRATTTVLDPYRGVPAALAAEGTAADLEQAITAAQAGFGVMRALPRHARRDLLARVADALTRERQALGMELAASCGKPIGQALGEVDRAIITFSFAARHPA